MRPKLEEATATDDPYEVISHYYDLFAKAGGPQQTSPRVDAFVELAQTGQTVLDVGSGTGTAALLLAEKECVVHCFEPSRAMRGVHLAKLAGHATLRERTTVLPSGYSFPLNVDFAMCAGVLQCLSAEERRELFGQLGCALRPGALLALDMVLEPGDWQPDRPRELAASVRVGRCRYEMWHTSTRISDLAARQRFDYRIFIDDRPEGGDVVDRTIHANLRPHVVNELRQVGFLPASVANARRLPADMVLVQRR